MIATFICDWFRNGDVPPSSYHCAFGSGWRCSGNRGLAPRILHFDGGWRCVVSLCLGRLDTGIIASNTHWIESWMDPRFGLNVGEEKNLLPQPGRKPRFIGSALRPLSVPTRDLSETSYISLSYFSTPHEYWFSLQLAVQVRAFRRRKKLVYAEIH